MTGSSGRPFCTEVYRAIAITVRTLINPLNKACTVQQKVCP